MIESCTQVLIGTNINDFQLASCLINAWPLLANDMGSDQSAFRNYILHSILLLIEWVHSFSKMLPYLKFTQDKVLVFIIVRKKMRK